MHDGLLYVAELWWAKGLKKGHGAEVGEHEYGRVSIHDTEGKLVARYGGGPPNTPGNLCAPHGIAVDSRGDVYVAEVTFTIGVSRGLAPEGTPTLQKLARR